jgi:hypothetical protein
LATKGWQSPTTVVVSTCQLNSGSEKDPIAFLTDFGEQTPGSLRRIRNVPRSTALCRPFRVRRIKDNVCAPLVSPIAEPMSVSGPRPRNVKGSDRRHRRPFHERIPKLAIIPCGEATDRHGRASVAEVDSNVVRVNTGCPEETRLGRVEVCDTGVEIVDLFQATRAFLENIQSVERKGPVVSPAIRSDELPLHEA